MEYADWPHIPNPAHRAALARALHAACTQDQLHVLLAVSAGSSPVWHYAACSVWDWECSRACSTQCREPVWGMWHPCQTGPTHRVWHMGLVWGPDPGQPWIQCTGLVWCECHMQCACQTSPSPPMLHATSTDFSLVRQEEHRAGLGWAGACALCPCAILVLHAGSSTGSLSVSPVWIGSGSIVQGLSGISAACSMQSRPALHCVQPEPDRFLMPDGTCGAGECRMCCMWRAALHAGWYSSTGWIQLVGSMIALD